MLKLLWGNVDLTKPSFPGVHLFLVLFSRSLNPLATFRTRWLPFCPLPIILSHDVRLQAIHRGAWEQSGIANLHCKWNLQMQTLKELLLTHAKCSRLVTISLLIEIFYFSTETSTFFYCHFIKNKLSKSSYIPVSQPLHDPARTLVTRGSAIQHIALRIILKGSNYL